MKLPVLGSEPPGTFQLTYSFVSLKTYSICWSGDTVHSMQHETTARKLAQCPERRRLMLRRRCAVQLPLFTHRMNHKNGAIPCCCCLGERHTLCPLQKKRMQPSPHERSFGIFVRLVDPLWGNDTSITPVQSHNLGEEKFTMPQFPHFCALLSLTERERLDLLRRLQCALLLQQ